MNDNYLNSSGVSKIWSAIKDLFLDRSIWVAVGGDDVGIFGKDMTNTAALNEFVGSKPKVTSQNGQEYGLILVGGKLYWTQYKITQVTATHVDQLFTRDPILIGPVEGSGNLMPTTLLIDVMGEVPTVGESAMVPYTQIYGKEPKVDDNLLYIRFTPSGIYCCGAKVTQYFSGRWKIDIEIASVSGVTIPKVSSGTTFTHIIPSVGTLPSADSIIEIEGDHVYGVTPILNDEVYDGQILYLTKGLYNVTVTFTNYDQEGDVYTAVLLSSPVLIANAGKTDNGDIKVISKEEYNTLSEDQKMADIVYIIPSTKTPSVDPDNIPSVLNDCTWEQISYLSQNNLFAEHFSVGDTKTIVLNGPIGDGFTADNLAIDLVVVGINHNAEIEGGNRVHFMCGISDGKLSALIDGKYFVTPSGDGVYFRIHNGNNNYIVGGWDGCDFKANIVPEIVAALPDDLRSVMKTVTKWTDNVGSSVIQKSDVTPTQENCCLISEYELIGEIVYSNQYEANKQMQYEYFSTNPGSENRLFYRYNDLSLVARYYTRSRSTYSVSYWVGVTESGKIDFFGNTYAFGIPFLIFV